MGKGGIRERCRILSFNRWDGMALGRALSSGSLQYFVNDICYNTLSVAIPSAKRLPAKFLERSLMKLKARCHNRFKAKGARIVEGRMSGQRKSR